MIINVQENVMVGSHGVFIDDRIENFLLYFVLPCQLAEENHIGSKLRNGLIVLYI